MKVLLVVPSLRKTGVTEVVKSLIYENSQHNLNIEYFLIALKDANNDSYVFDDLLGNHIYKLGGRRILSAYKIYKFKKIVKRINPDIVHFNSFEADLYSLFLNVKNYKMISTAHNNGEEDFRSSYGKMIGTIMAKIQLKIFNRLDGVVAVSNTVKNHFKGRIACNIMTILNGVNPGIERKTFIDKNQLQDLVRPIGIYSGNLSARKNVDNLFKSYKKINFSKTRSSLIVIGDDPQNSKKVEEYKEKYGNYGIKFFGRVENVYPYLSIADYWISASKNEGLPMAAIEAMAQNLDLILSDIPQHRELKVSKEQDISFFENNIEELTQAINNYVQNWDLGNRSNNGYYFKTFFSSKRMYEDYVKKYKILKAKD